MLVLRDQREIGFVLNSDDELAPNTTRMLSTLDCSTRLVCFGVHYLERDGTIEHRKTFRWKALFNRLAHTPADPFLWFDFYYHGLIARRQVIEQIGGYGSDLPVGEDQDVLLRACETLTVQEIMFSEQVGYLYREDPVGVCQTRWSEVEANYALTMVQAANCRGADFDACRLAAELCVDGAIIDEYSYRRGAKWLRWREISGL